MTAAQPIRAEISGDTCGAFGVTARSSSPILSLCRKLIEASHDPATPLEAYRGNTLCLRIQSIDEAAGLEVAGNGVGFLRTPKRRRGSPVEFQHEEAA
jgi:hypothetical protein